jgi:hypothetical protein
MYPTWAQALTGIDLALLTPMSTPPETWPLQAAVWRRQLRHRLMVQLTCTRWITLPGQRDLHRARCPGQVVNAVATVGR